MYFARLDFLPPLLSPLSNEPEEIAFGLNNQEDCVNWGSVLSESTVANAVVSFFVTGSNLKGFRVKSFSLLKILRNLEKTNSTTGRDS